VDLSVAGTHCARAGETCRGLHDRHAKRAKTFGRIVRSDRVDDLRDTIGDSGKIYLGRLVVDPERWRAAPCIGQTGRSDQGF
jgi:hypothetical protein